MEFLFERLIAPIPIETFFSEYWEKKPLHISRGDPSYYEDLVSTRELDALITGFAGEAGMDLTLIQSEGGNTSTRRFGAGFPYDHQSVYRSFGRGSTVQIRAAQRHLAGGQVIASEVTKHTSAPVKINVYLTPRNSRAFNIHQDGHEVLVAQVKGRKHWNLYADPVELPNDQLLRGRPELFDPEVTRYHARHERSDEPPLERELVLEQGDFLYIPRGVFHAAYTSDALSLHLTIGAYTLTWHDALLVALADVFDKSPELRRSLPHAFARGGNRSEVEELARDVASAVRDRLDAGVLAEAVDTVGRQVVAKTAAPFHGFIDDVDLAPSLGSADAVRTRPGVLYRVDDDGGKSILAFNGRTVGVPNEASDLLDKVRDGRAFTSDDLSETLPSEVRLNLVRKLVQIGLLAPASEPAVAR